MLKTHMTIIFFVMLRKTKWEAFCRNLGENRKAVEKWFKTSTALRKRDRRKNSELSSNPDFCLSLTLC